MGLKKTYDDLQKFQLKNDSDGSTGVQYDDGKTPGVLRTPNAGMKVESGGAKAGGAGLEIRYTGDGIIDAFDRDNSTRKDLLLRGSLIDMSTVAANLRLATGQSIEDGSGTDRITFKTNTTSIRDQGGKIRFTARSGNPTQIQVDDTTFFRMFDQEGGFTAYRYLPSASAPGTLELTNAGLRVGFADGADLDVVDSFTGIGGDENTTRQARYAIFIKSDRTATSFSQRIEFNDNSDGSSTILPFIRARGGNMQASDNNGNITVIS